MALNYVFIFFFLVSILSGIVQFLFFGNSEIFGTMVGSLFKMSETAVSLCIYLIGIMSLWLGILKIGEDSGMIDKLTKIVAPIFSKLFPEIPKNHPAQSTIMMNIAANMLGLDNAATPLGLKAMNDLQSINPEKESASNSMIMFLVLNTSGLTLIPVSVIALRAAAGASNPTDVFIPILFATTISTLVGLISVSIYQKINLINIKTLLFVGIIISLVFGGIFLINQFALNIDQNSIAPLGNLILLLMIGSFVLMGFLSKINVYDAFIAGAKDGFKIAIDIIPYLVAMLVGIGLFRSSGIFDLILDGMSYIFMFFGMNTDFVAALPTALMKPLSGSGARGMMVETMNTYGADSFVGKLAATFQGSTETTFYTLAVYYGAVRIKNIRYTLVCGLLADLAGILAAIFIAYIMF